MPKSKPLLCSQQQITKSASDILEAWLDFYSWISMVISKNSLWIYLNIISTIQYLSDCNTNIVSQKYLFLIMITDRKLFLLHLEWAVFLTSLKNVCLTITKFQYLTCYMMYRLSREKIKIELMLFSSEWNYLALLYFQGTYLLIYLMKNFKK